MRIFIGFFVGIVFLGGLYSYCFKETTKGQIVEKTTFRPLDSNEILNYSARFNKFFDSLLLNHGFSGGILVAKNGQILYEKYQGLADINHLEPIHSSTPFHVASTSKTFTSTAILQLLSKGNLSLTDTLGTYFPGFPYSGVTIWHLLSHSSGIPNYAYFLPKFGWNTQLTVTNQDVLDLLTQYKPYPEFKLGSRFKYCNTNFVLLALLVEKVSGTSFPYYIEKNIFEPAGMKDSYVVSALTPSGYMPSWNATGGLYKFDYLDGLYGDKNVYTTCRDLFHFDSALQNGLLLDTQILAKAYSPTFLDNSYGEVYEHYGLGWRLKTFTDNLYIAYHNGWWHGNNAVFQRLVADTAVIIITGNKFNKKIYAGAKAANYFRQYYGTKQQMEQPAENDTLEIKNAQAGKVSVRKKKPISNK